MSDSDEAEKQLEKALQERDEAEDALSHAYYLITGKSPEWSNLFGYAEALEEINDCQVVLRTEIAQLREPLTSVETTHRHNLDEGSNG